ncbi:MAG: hypothetical protein ABIF11_03935 [Nitrospirota bacterium]
MRILRDSEIAKLISETKILPDNWQSSLQLKDKSNFQYMERTIKIKGKEDNIFRIILC